MSNRQSNELSFNFSLFDATGQFFVCFSLQNNPASSKTSTEELRREL